MVDWQTIRVPKPAYQEAKQAKSDQETWGEYLGRCANQPTAVMSEDDIRRIAQEEIQSTVVENARL